MITNLHPPPLPPKAKQPENVGICLLSHHEVFQTEVWAWRGGHGGGCNESAQLSRCLFSFWLDCVSLDVSPGVSLWPQQISF